MRENFNCMFLSCHVRVSEWIHTLQLPECQGNPCNWTRTHNHLVHKRTLNHLAKLISLAKWLSIRLWTKWLQVRVQLKSLKSFYFVSLHDLLLDTSLGLMTLFRVGFFYIIDNIAVVPEIIWSQFLDEFIDGAFSTYTGDCSTGPWHNTLRMIALLLFYTELYIQ